MNKKNIFIISLLALFVFLFLGIYLENYTSKLIFNLRSKIKTNQQALLMRNQNQKQNVDSKIIYSDAIQKVMSDKEFEDFKNALSVIAINNDVTITKLSDSFVRDIKDYKENKISLEAVATYDAYKNFKNKIASLNYFINFDKEIIMRENATSNKIKISSEILLVVFPKKDETVKTLKN
jgi:Tfp pilus assembly protein PilO